MTEKLVVGEFKEGNNFISYCETCATEIYQGNDKDQAQNRVLYSSAINHIEGQETPHEVTIIYPHKKESVSFMEMVALKKMQIGLSMYDLIRSGKLTLPEEEEDCSNCEHQDTCDQKAAK